MKRLFDISAAIFVLVMMPQVVHAISVTDLNSMLANLDSSIPGVVQFIFAACYVMGIFFILRAVYKLKQHAQGISQMSQEKSVVKPLIVMLVGVGFIWLPLLMDSLLASLWNYGTDSVVAYPEQSDPFVLITGPLIDIIRVFGLIAIVRGWALLVKLGSEGHTEGVTGKAIIHILGGVLAWNVVGFWSVIQNTLGIAG